METKKMKYKLVYDKFIPNKFGGCSKQRTTIVADTKDIATRRMKEDLYIYGCYQGCGIVHLPNGQTKVVKPNKRPTLSYSDKNYRSQIVSRKIVK